MMRAFALLMFAIAGRAELIDRIAVALNHDVITESEVLRQIRITAFLNGTEPDYSGASKRDAADRLIDQALIRREMQVNRFGITAGPDATQRYDEVRRHYPSEPAYQERLAGLHLTDADVREALQWQSEFLQFVDVRFRPGIQIPEEEIRDYYEREVKPKSPELPYADARADVEEILMAQRIDNAVDRWLGQTRTQTRILYKQEAFQ